MPPPTPSSSNYSSGRTSERLFETVSDLDHLSSQSSLTQNICHTPPLSYHHQFHQYPNHVDDSHKKTKAENIWKQIYDYFEYYNDRACHNEELIEKRLAEARSMIPVIVDDTLNTNFTMITDHMNQDTALYMRTPSDYSYLYERRVYIDQLCYLFWLVEDVCNRVSYIETLYPSTRLMAQSQLHYAEPKFQNITKTLWLWYKIVFGLMHTCDVVGNYLGFTKREENKQYWTWLVNIMGNKYFFLEFKCAG